MSFPFRFEQLFSPTAALPPGGKQHLWAMWEAYSSMESRRYQQRLIVGLTVGRGLILVATLIGSLAALSQYRYYWVFPIYVIIKMMVMSPLSRGIDVQLDELQSNPDSRLWHGREFIKVCARLALLLLLAPFWVVFLLGRALDRARMSLASEISLQGRGYSFEDITQDQRYGAATAILDFLRICEVPRLVGPSVFVDFAVVRVRAIRDLGSLAESFEAKPLGTTFDLEDRERWDEIERKYTEYIWVLEKPQ